MSKEVLILGSGLSAREYDPIRYSNFIIVAVNNAWTMVPSRWNYWIRSPDYVGARPLLSRDKGAPNSIEVTKYGWVMLKYGGHRAVGYSMCLVASYYALHVIQPSRILYLGCDMNYTPNEAGETHIYGIGYDIRKSGKSDPDKMISMYGEGDPHYLSNLYGRFEKFANESRCIVRNASTMANSRLPYERCT